MKKLFQLTYNVNKKKSFQSIRSGDDVRLLETSCSGSFEAHEINK